MDTLSFDPEERDDEKTSSAEILLFDNPPTAVAPNGNLAAAGVAANVVVAQHIFQKYLSTKSENTLIRHGYDLRLFAEYLTAVGITLTNEDFQYDPQAWAGISWGLVEGFLAWQLRQGYAVTSANARLSTVRTYCKLATKAGAINKEEGMMITTVSGYSRKEGLNLDEKRDVTRVGDKKAMAISISAEKAEELKGNHDETPAGKRNRLIACLLLDHGLRASEVVGLTKAGFDFDAGTLTFWRKKTKEWTTHKLTADTLVSALGYRNWMPDEGAVFWGSRKGGELTKTKLNRITVSRLVQRLGVDVGFYRQEVKVTRGGKRKVAKVGTLSAHDCRHYCATDMANRGYSVKKLMDWFGWASPAMAMRYVESAEVQVRDLG